MGEAIGWPLTLPTGKGHNEGTTGLDFDLVQAYLRYVLFKWVEATDGEVTEEATKDNQIQQLLFT